MTEPRVRLRQGRKVGRTLYEQVGDEPSDADVLVGLVDTPELAATIVTALDYDAALEDLTPPEALEVLMGAALAEATAHPRCFDCGTTHDPDPDACPKAEWQATP